MDAGRKADYEKSEIRRFFRSSCGSGTKEEGLRYVQIERRKSELVGLTREKLVLFGENTWWVKGYGYNQQFSTHSQKDR